MKNPCFLFLLFPLFTFTYLSYSSEIILVDSGKTDYTIIISDTASDSEKYAARELQQFLIQIGNIRIPIFTDNFPLPKKAILLGNNKFLKSLGVKRDDFNKFKGEGYIIRTKENYLIIAGPNPRGTLFGVYGFLEDHLGCKWFTPDCSYIPQTDKIQIPDIDETIIPKFEYRDDFYSDCFDGTWVLRNRLNSSSAEGIDKKGGKVRFGKNAFCHTFYSLVPPDKYFDKHPEYFSLINGKRQKSGAQLCLTNPDIIKIAADQVKKWIEEDPDATIFSVSQNDCFGFCECKKCKEFDDAEESHSGTLINFVNAVADKIALSHPQKIIETLAYQYTRKPPKTLKTHPNVVIRLCSIECCFSHPLAADDFDQNKSFREDIEKWQSHCGRIYIWDYVTNFAHYIMPFPNLRVLKPNMKFFAEHNVKGIFEEGNYSKGGHGEMASLRGYLLAKFLWNPEYDYDKALNEFINVYYGKASPYIKEYINLIHDKVEKLNFHLTIYLPPSSAYLDADIINKASEIFDRAEQSVSDNPTLLMRVYDARLPIQYVQISNQFVDGSGKYVVKDNNFLPDNNNQMFKIIKSFNENALSLGMTSISEGTLMEDYLKRINSSFLCSEIIKTGNKISEICVAPHAGGRITSWTLLKDNKELITLNDMNTNDPATIGGYSENYSAAINSLGLSESYEIKQSDSSITSAIKFQNNIRIKRQYVVQDNFPAISISTKVINIAKNNDASKPFRIRSYSCWNLGNSTDLVIYLTAFSPVKKIEVNSLSENLKRQIYLESKDIGDELIIWNAKEKFGIKIKQNKHISSVQLNFKQGSKITNLIEATKFLTFDKSSSFTAEKLYTAIFELPEFSQTEAYIVPELKNILEITPENFYLYKEGDLTKIIGDKTSPSGVCASLTGNTTEWAIQWRIPDGFLEQGTVYNAKALVKIDKKGDNGKAFDTGIWDSKNNHHILQISVRSSEMNDGEWEEINIGKFVFSGKQYIWFAPTKNTDNVMEIFVGAIIISKD